MKNIFFIDESVKRQITDSISENLTDSDLESNTHVERITFCIWKKWTKQAISRLLLITVENCYIPQLVNKNSEEIAEEVEYKKEPLSVCQNSSSTFHLSFHIRQMTFIHRMLVLFIFFRRKMSSFYMFVAQYTITIVRYCFP